METEISKTERKTEFERTRTRGATMRIWSLLKGWLTSFLDAREKFLREMNESINNMSPEDRERWARFQMEQQFGRNPLGFF